MFRDMNCTADTFIQRFSRNICGYTLFKILKICINVCCSLYNRYKFVIFGINVHKQLFEKTGSIMTEVNAAWCEYVKENVFCFT